MKLVRLSAGIQDILRPVSKMANTSDRLVSEHTVKEMGYDELLLLHPPVTAGERARRVCGYLAPPLGVSNFLYENCNGRTSTPLPKL